MNLYILSGEDIYREEEGLRNLLQKYEIDEDHRSVIDASDARSFHMENVLIECDSFSLFDEGMKAVIVKEPYFLRAASRTAGKSTAKKKTGNDAEEHLRIVLEQYLKNVNPNTLFIFYCHLFNADTRKKEYKLLTKYGAETMTFSKMDERTFTDYASKELQKQEIKLDSSSMKVLLERVSLDTLLLHRAIEKICLYGKKDPDLNDIKHLIPMNPDVDVFQITSAFTAGDLAGALSAANDMVLNNYNYTVLISMLSKRLRSIYCMKLLYEEGLDEDAIAVRMKANRGYVWHVLQDSTALSSMRILKLLNDLAEIDQGIKQGVMDPQYSFEQFLIHNVNQKTMHGYDR